MCAPVPLDTLFLQFLERLNAPLVDSIQQMVKEHEISIYWYSYPFLFSHASFCLLNSLWATGLCSIGFYCLVVRIVLVTISLRLCIALILVKSNDRLQVRWLFTHSQDTLAVSCACMHTLLPNWSSSNIYCQDF